MDVTSEAEAVRIIDMIGNAVFKSLATRVLAGLRFLVPVAFGTDLFPILHAVGKQYGQVSGPNTRVDT